MDLTDFLDAVRPGLQPDISLERQLALREGYEPQNYDEEVWLEWNS